MLFGSHGSRWMRKGNDQDPLQDRSWTEESRRGMGSKMCRMDRLIFRAIVRVEEQETLKLTNLSSCERASGQEIWSQSLLSHVCSTRTLLWLNFWTFVPQRQIWLSKMRLFNENLHDNGSFTLGKNPSHATMSTTVSPIVVDHNHQNSSKYVSQTPLPKQKWLLMTNY